MKKTILILLAIIGLQTTTYAQRYAFVDTDYVLRNIPAFQAAQEQLNQLSTRWQAEIEEIYQEVARMYQNYQTESVFLSAEMRTSREEAIIAKEREAKMLQHKYFGAEGEMAKRQETLIQPIQEQVSNAIREIAREEDLAAVFDKANGVLYLDPRHDRSDQVLQRLGHRR
ncbi:OmpH family outer membrane protein [Natronoflexus pectinivorans]|uniref:Outer membrane protein n=1 Tax=Natronoflexus pectinivorans TaxID=682526 RepID=A0A4R2GN42_9BACT|nr:OmpH family outer membrane protein [Natronoflexus pectinivorans]TCO10408.1 outer membrane protein [Natronoflexus pectinivorans]